MMPRLILRSERGLSVLSVLFITGFVALGTLGPTIFLDHERQKISEFKFKQNLFYLRQDLLAKLGDQATWQKNIDLNPSMACLKTHTCVNGQGTGAAAPAGTLDPQQLAYQNRNNWIIPKDGRPPQSTSSEIGRAPAAAQPIGVSNLPKSNMAIYGSDGNLIYNPSDVKAGFSMNGKPCDEYSPAGSDACPLKIEVSWVPSCWNPQNPGSCVNPEEIVTINFIYNPASPQFKFPFNPANYGISLPRLYMGTATAIQRCAGAKGIYVGNFPGSPNSAFGLNSDAAGCVPYTVFQGPMGPQGSEGPKGLPGLKGPPGPAGDMIIAWEPKKPEPPPPEPICTAEPPICGLYKSLLGRFPDQAGAIFWQTWYAELRGLGLSETEALGRVWTAMDGSIESQQRNHGIQATAEQIAQSLAEYQAYAASTGTTGAECSTNPAGASCLGVAHFIEAILH